jgi:hypothetical protein
MLHGVARLRRETHLRTMNPNDFYSDVASFWSRIAPILFFHLAVLAALRYIGRVRFGVRERIEQAMQGETYQRRKAVLAEFNLWTKLPYLAIVAALIYLVLFQSVVDWATGLRGTPLSISYSEAEFWAESGRAGELGDVLQYAPARYTDVGRALEVKDAFLEEYQAKYPERYRSLVGWVREEYGGAFNRYRLTLIGLLIAVLLPFARVSDRTRWLRISAARLVALFAVALLAAAYARVRAEQWLERQLLAETSFVRRQLEIDPAKASGRSNGERGDTLARALVVNGSAAHWRPSHFWALRLGERLGLERPFTTNGSGGRRS